MRIINTVIGLLLLLTSVPSFAAPTEKAPCPHDKQTVGWIERVKLLPYDLELEAKLAPAIGTSSLHAENIKEFTRKKKSFVKFEIEDRRGKQVKIEVPLLSTKKTVTAKGNKRLRRVVKLGLCIKDVYLVPHHQADISVYPPVLEAIQNADYIFIGPGDLFTSIIPNLIVPGVTEALQKTTAKIYYIINIMTKFGETEAFAGRAHGARAHAAGTARPTGSAQSRVSVDFIHIDFARLWISGKPLRFSASR